MKNKAVLIIDMPSCCNKCPCFDCGDDRCCCNALNKDFTNEDTRIIYKDCPLKPMPNKTNNFEIFGNATFVSKEEQIAYLCGNEDGWNDCIDEIIGGEEE